MSEYRNFYAGRFVEASSPKRIDVRNPATGEVFTSVPAASEADAVAAVDAARTAQHAWRALPAIERGNALRRLADALIQRAERIGTALAAESGKSLADATSEVVYGVELMRYHAEWARRIEGEVIESDNADETLILRREPIGVVACLIPFNYPIYTLVRKIAPALIAGNAVVVRPSNNTPASALVFAEAVLDADLPAGLINILTMDHDVARMGPLANETSRQRIHAMVERARAEGATVEAGGYLPEGDGYFYPPTLLSGCRQDMEIVREEVFGPVLAVLSYAEFDDALALASDHQFGLSSVLFTENYRKAMRAAATIEAGELYINRFPADPYQGFHSGWKKSGLGGDDGKHGMLEFTQTRLVILKH